MKISSQNIYQILEASPKGLTSKELLIALSQSKAKKTALRKELKYMAQKGLVKKQSAHYQLTGVSLRPGKKQRKEKEFFARKDKINQSLKGRGLYLLIKGKGYVQPYAATKMLPVLVDSANPMSLVHSDEVTFEIAGEGESQEAVIHSIEGRVLERLRATLDPKDGQVFAKMHSFHFPNPLPVANLKFDPELKGKEAMIEIFNLPTGSVRMKRILPEMPLVEKYKPVVIAHNLEKSFLPSTLIEAENFSEEVEQGPDSERQDLRHLPFVTIDGADAKDYDDAIYTQKEGEEGAEGYRIFVSIADVAEYVRPNSSLDNEASQRATSVYLPGMVIPMLPERLSNDLCSLREGRPRFTLTAEMLIDEAGEVQEFKAYESIIKVAKRLTYDEVDQFFETGQSSHEESLQELLTISDQVAHKLRTKRTKRGSIGFTLPDFQFDFDQNQKLEGIHQVFQTKAQKLIEQFMLEANEQIGHFVDQHELDLLWRNHPDPLPEKLIALKEMLWNEKIRIKDLSDGKGYNEVLKMAKNSPKQQQIEYSLLRSMSLAVYRADREGHFGLAASHYLHFTSPIRRYPDLVVHRSLKQLLQNEMPYTMPKQLGEHCSDQERNAQKAERLAQKIQSCDYMSSFLGNCYTAKVVGVIGAGLFMQVKEPYFEGFIPFVSILDDRYDVSADNQVAHGKRSKRVIKIGDQIQVMLNRIDTRKNAIDFKWLYFLDK